MEIKRWDKFIYNGQAVEVIAVDSDPEVAVLVVLVSNPEVALQVNRSSLTSI